jgi:ABC-type lipoprotein export system ATPase subunit
VALMVVTHSLKLAQMIGQVHFLEGGKLMAK